ncbi:ATP-binding protein [Algirhabdus cladophorae]|uniref:ATP-binding protein n=1 Tax=Algirhabdus cladophorae TaxID=3377108 RepID=UPI003B8482CB
MTAFNLIVAACLAYVVILFAVAWAAERRAKRGQTRWLRSPLIYTLSLSVYCTAWTFYGAVGYAARSGLEYLTIYLGPTLVMIGWWLVLRKLVQVGRAQRITSIADLISLRFGKSNVLGVLVTLLAVVGTTPYIALQLQSVTLSFAVLAPADTPIDQATDLARIALWVAIGLALFTILFGTRNLDVNERHHGVVMAIAVEAVVKLVALISVGIFVVWGLGGGVGGILSQIDASPIARWDIDPNRWAGLIFLSAAAFLCLPRMFQVLVVESQDEGNLATASWAFPAYLLAMSLFVVPIAVVGLAVLPEGENPDLFVLTLPLSQDRQGLALLSFLGGFSSATSMVIVASIALSTMVSNNIVMPLWLRSQTVHRATISGDVRNVVLVARRLSIAAILALGYIYYRLSGGGAALASIGLIAFAGVSQVLPALLGGIFWRGATRAGAASGLIVGFAIWLYTLFLPSFGGGIVFPELWLSQGPLGMSWLKPQALFGLQGMDPLLHSVFWSMVLNTGVFALVSISTFPGPMERLQGAQVVNALDQPAKTQGWSDRVVEAEDLLVMAQRIIGSNQAQGLFQAQAKGQGKLGYLPDITPDFIARLERELAGSVGSATAHAMVSQIAGGVSVTVQDLMAVADEAAQIMEYSNQLELQSEELTRTARQLREANQKLTQLSVQKDAFLSQISHELRTPMTSIRAFSEILRDVDDIETKDKSQYATIIHDEAQRLTRLLDDLLDLSVLESGQVSLNLSDARLSDMINQAVQSTESIRGTLLVTRSPADEDVVLHTDPDRLAQVFINLIANAAKYCEAGVPVLKINVRQTNGGLEIDFVDNGLGINPDNQSVIFEKFSRLGDTSKAGGAGLGLAICREIVQNLGGTIDYVPGQGGAAFRLQLPQIARIAAQ